MKIGYSRTQIPDNIISTLKLALDNKHLVIDLEAKGLVRCLRTA